METQNERDRANETVKDLKAKLKRKRSELLACNEDLEAELKRKRSVEQKLSQEMLTWKKKYFGTKKSNGELQIHLCDLQSNHL